LSLTRDIPFGAGAGDIVSKISITVTQVTLLGSGVYLSNRATCFDFKLT